MNSEEWNKFCSVFNLDVEVKVRKEVTRSDILQTLLNEGEFVFKSGKNGWTQISLEKLKGKLDKKQIKLYEDLLWKQIEGYLLKPKKVLKNGGQSK